MKRNFDDDTIPTTAIFDDEPPDKVRKYLRMATFNVMSANGNNLNVVLRTLAQMKIEIALLTETKLTTDYYTRAACGYRVVATKAESRSQGGVALIYREHSNQWAIEGIRRHGPNVISCTLVSGRCRWSIVGGYIPPSDVMGATLHFIQEAVETRVKHPIIFLGDLNVDFRAPRDPRDEEIVTGLMSWGLVDVSDHFTHPRGRWTWSQKRQRRYIRSCCDYVLSTAPQDFRRWVVRSPRYYSDHRALVVEIGLDRPERHARYLKRRLFFRPRIPRPFTRVDTLFETLLQHRKQPSTKEQRDRSWISAATWRLIDRRAALHRLGGTVDNDLHKAIRRSLRKDRRARARRTSEEIQALTLNKDWGGAYALLRGWYRNYNETPTKPVREDLNAVRTQYKELYKRRESPGVPIPIHVTPFSIDDNIPSEDEIITGLKRLRRHSAPGLSGIQVEDILNWKRLFPDVWKIVVELVCLCFTDETPPRAFAYAVMVLLPKAEADKFRSISLLEVVYKLITSIIHLRMSAAIQFHPAIHGFRSSRGTSTAQLECKLQMQLALVKGQPLFQVFLDLSKAYDSLDRDRTLQVLEAYGVGPNVLHFLSCIWEWSHLVPRIAGYYGAAFQVERGVPQGDVISPIIFNVIMDVIVREWEVQMSSNSDLPSLFFLCR